MALDIDGFAVLGAIAANRASFPSIASEASKIARSLVVKQLRSKDTSLNLIRNMHGVLGAKAFNLILEGVTDDQIKSLVVKVDKYNPDLKTATAQWRLQRMQALADSSADPTERAKTASKMRPDEKPKVEAAVAPERLAFRSAGAKRRR
jgi:hypothetical protein